MADFTAADVKKLREATGAGMMDCKKALQESDGDLDKAVEYLRVKGLRGVAKREGRSASNGLVAAQLDGTSAGVLLELNCETDFVAKGERFQQVATDVVAHVAATAPADLPTLLASQISAGTSVQQFLDQANAALGEKIELRRFARFDDGHVTVYLHKTSPDLPPQVGVLVELAGGDAGVAKDVAQHIAAFSPAYVTRDEVPSEVVENERRLAEETAREEGKPEQALPKIIDGRLTGFFKENVLVDQAFAKDPKKTVKAVLDAAGASVKRFARYRVGS